MVLEKEIVNAMYFKTFDTAVNSLLTKTFEAGNKAKVPHSQMIFLSSLGKTSQTNGAVCRDKNRQNKA